MSEVTVSPLPLALDDLPRLRGVLAVKRIPHKALAEAAGLSTWYCCRILAESARPGALARVRLAAGIARLGIDESELRHARIA
jgi:hypothetical protein